MLTDTNPPTLQSVAIAWPAWDDSTVRALALAVFVQAVRDASTTRRGREGDSTRRDARAWLLEEGATWARLLGMRIDQAAIQAWIDADCPPGDRRKRSQHQESTVFAGS